MAVRDPQVIKKTPGYAVYLWEQLEDTDTASALFVGDYDDITVYADGDFESAAVTLAMHGAPTDTSALYRALSDANTGSAIGMTADGIALISEACMYIKPVASGGSAGQDIDIYIVCK